MPVHPLTPKQLAWLRSAQAAGYERGFVAWPDTTLRTLEKHRFIERNPSTLGRNTQWRITERGERYLAGYEGDEA